MDGRHEFPCRETEEDAGREIVLADPVAELEVLMEHGAEGQGDRLECVSGKKDGLVNDGVLL